MKAIDIEEVNGIEIHVLRPCQSDTSKLIDVQSVEKEIELILPSSHKHIVS